MGQGHRVSLLPAINLSQLSEFSLVILALGFKAGHLNKQTKGIAAYAFVILAIVSSYAMFRSDSLLRRISPWLNKIRLRDLNRRTDHIGRTERRAADIPAGVLLDRQFIVGGNHPARAELAEPACSH